MVTSYLLCLDSRSHILGAQRKEEVETGRNIWGFVEAVEKKRKGQPGQGLFSVETDAYLNTAVGWLSIKYFCYSAWNFPPPKKKLLNINHKHNSIKNASTLLLLAAIAQGSTEYETIHLSFGINHFSAKIRTVQQYKGLLRECKLFTFKRMRMPSILWRRKLAKDVSLYKYTIIIQLVPQDL